MDSKRVVIKSKGHANNTKVWVNGVEMLGVTGIYIEPIVANPKSTIKATITVINPILDIEVDADFKEKL